MGFRLRRLLELKDLVRLRVAMLIADVSLYIFEVLQVRNETLFLINDALEFEKK